MKVKTSELEGSALDWVVAVAMGYKSTKPTGMVNMLIHPDSGFMPMGEWSPSTDWSQGGPLIELNEVDIESDGEWSAFCFSLIDDRAATMCGNTPLIAACRAIVAAKLGDEVEVPDELLQ